MTQKQTSTIIPFDENINTHIPSIRSTIQRASCEIKSDVYVDHRRNDISNE